MATALTNNKASFVKIYKSELDGKVKERMLLVLDVAYHGKIAAHVARDLHRNRSWACKWLKRYDEEGIEGLRDRPKSGRPAELSAEIEYEIKTILTDSNQGWTTKQVEELIIKETGIKYHYTHIYRILRRWGFKQKVPRKVHVNTASAEEKDEFKKRSNKYLWVSPAPTNTKIRRRRRRKTLP
jgi:putative transposase